MAELGPLAALAALAFVLAVPAVRAIGLRNGLIGGQAALPKATETL
jgi:hypothetical protein